MKGLVYRMELARKVQAYLNKRGITQAQFCKRAGLKDRSRLAKQLVANKIKHPEDEEKIKVFFEREQP